jgi:predicted HNH restriction endonuclease
MRKSRLSISLIASILFSSFGFTQDSTLNLPSFAASFKMAENQYIKKLVVAVKDSKLVATSDASPNEFIVLTPSKTTNLFTTKIQSYDAEFLFSRTETGIKSVKITIAGGQVVLMGDKEVSEYASSFKMAENQYCKKIFIIEKEGKLFAQSDASQGEAWELKTKSTDAFSATIQNYPAELVFIRDGGKIKAIKLSVADGQVVLTGEKE